MRAAQRHSAQAAAGFGMQQGQQPHGRREQPEQQHGAQAEQRIGRALPRRARSRSAAAPNASRSHCRLALAGAAPMRPCSTSSRQAERRTLPLEVLSTVCGGASTISSAGSPIASTTACDTASRNAAVSRAAARAQLGQHDEPLGAAARIGPAEHRDAALADAVDRADRVLDLLRVQVAAATDHDVLDAAGDVDVAVGDVGPVAGVEPAAGRTAAPSVRGCASSRAWPTGRGTRVGPRRARAALVPASSTMRTSCPGSGRPQATKRSAAASSAAAGARAGARARSCRARCGRCAGRARAAETAARPTPRPARRPASSPRGRSPQAAKRC